jgi:hypothetical protein
MDKLGLVMMNWIFLIEKHNNDKMRVNVYINYVIFIDVDILVDKIKQYLPYVAHIFFTNM